VVQETDNQSELSCASSALTKLDFPAPLGATTIKTFPATEDMGDNGKIGQNKSIAESLESSLAITVINDRKKDGPLYD
jgi:hypothetical protein